MENKLKKIAIKGHETRGKEVLEILEMLGGKNKGDLNGQSRCFYFIDCNNNIDLVSQSRTNFMTFYLEDFLEKYPYKVGDKCKYNGHVYFYRQQKFVTISSMRYVNDTIEYRIDKGIWVKAEYLQPYEEEVKTEDRLKIYTDPAADDSKTAIDIFVSNESLGLKNGYIADKVEIKDCGIVLKCVKNKPQYPKTYEECYAILNQNLDEHSVIGYRSTDVYNLQLLLICRDAFWKIAGEEMGLDESWKPFADDEGKTHALYYNRYTDSLDKCEGLFESNAILDFPTKEMRDAFFENFKDLIEKCKEFL